jgi:hypothetical protein
MPRVAAEDPRARKGEAAPVHVAKRWHFQDLDSVCSACDSSVRSGMAHGAQNWPGTLSEGPWSRWVLKVTKTKLCIQR